MKMKVLLTGATGFIGHHVLQVLQHQGIDVIAVGRVRPRVPVEFIKTDLLQTADFHSLFCKARCTHLLHLAWYAEHSAYWTSSLNLRWVEATVRLIEGFCKAGGQRAVVAGTCAEYDWSYGYCREDSTPLNPTSLYGAAKNATRQLVMAICAQHKTSCAWGRIFIPFGDREAATRLIPSLFDVFRGIRSPFAVNAAAYRDFLHVSDAAKGLVTLLHHTQTDTYNISSGIPIHLQELVNTVANLLNADPTPVLILSDERPNEPRLLVGDNTKLCDIGWRPTLTLMQGLKDTLINDESSLSEAPIRSINYENSAS